jgi:transposase InsO family protein
VSTIWRILSERGFVTPQPHKRPKSSFVRFAAAQPNERWQLDTTHWALADGTDVEILNQIDDHSRLVVGSHARRVFKAADVVDCFRQATTRYGLPAQMLSDNGAVFTGVPRRAGRVAFELELAALGISFRHSRPYHPQTCGKVERFHQTLKRWLARQHQPHTLRALQAQLDTFVEYYNTRRPHRALHRHTPADAFAARPKATRPARRSSTVTIGSAATASTPPASSPCATTASSTTSASDDATPEPACSCSSTTSTSASSTTPANSSAN